ncbi:MAG: methyltransferase [Candidatus Nephrothrix sp. EaCA]|nr:MAG: methyltransferase [Candidatus Nephrothrix sp. EaCA]
MESWVNRNHADSSDLILQMDIEGNEYEVISHASQELLTRFRIIAIEFHELDELFCSFGLRIIQSAFAKLLKNFSVVHLHPNNCGCLARFKEYALPKTMEVTFLRKDRIVTQKPQLNFPHVLDEKNTNLLPDIILPPCWYQPAPK